VTKRLIESAAPGLMSAIPNTSAPGARGAELPHAPRLGQCAAFQNWAGVSKKYRACLRANSLRPLDGLLHF